MASKNYYRKMSRKITLNSANALMNMNNIQRSTKCTHRSKICPLVIEANDTLLCESSKFIRSQPTLHHTGMMSLQKGGL